MSVAMLFPSDVEIDRSADEELTRRVEAGYHVAALVRCRAELTRPLHVRSFDGHTSIDIPDTGWFPGGRDDETADRNAAEIFDGFVVQYGVDNVIKVAASLALAEKHKFNSPKQLVAIMVRDQ